jgi:type I restriction enzyme S subunit
MPGDYPYYGANGQVGTVGDYLFDGEYVLLAEDGGHFDQSERGVAYQVNGRFWVNNHAHILSTLGDMPASYIRRLLNTLDWMRFVSGTTRMKLTQAGMERIQVPVAPLAEQRRIVARLDALTARLANVRTELNLAAVLAQNLRQRVVTSAFRGELTAEWRSENPDEVPLSTDQTAAAYATAAGAERRGSPVAIDWQPDIALPHMWRWASIDELVSVVQYGTSAKTSDHEGVPVLRMGNIQRGELDWANLKYLPADHSEFPDLLLADGDVLFNRTNSAELVGKSAVFRGQPRPVSFASYLIRVRCSAILPDLLARYLNSAFGRAWASKSASQQVGQANINGSKLKALGIPLPPPAEQQEMLRLIGVAFARADRIDAEVKRAQALLGRLEAAILTKAFRGELVAQDPDDEPATVLLGRIRAQRAAAPNPRRRRPTGDAVHA